MTDKLVTKMCICKSTYPRATGDWMRVFTRSRGWKMMVEHVPLNDPAKKDLTTGDCNTTDIVTHTVVNMVRQHITNGHDGRLENYKSKKIDLA